MRKRDGWIIHIARKLSSLRKNEQQMSSRREKYQQILTDNEMVSWALFTQFVLDEDLLVFVPLFVHMCECNSVSVNWKGVYWEQPNVTLNAVKLQAYELGRTNKKPHTSESKKKTLTLERVLRANVIHLLLSMRTNLVGSLYTVFITERSYILWSLLLSDYIQRQLPFYGAFIYTCATFIGRLSIVSR